MKKIALLAFTALLSGTALMAQDTSLNKGNNPTTNPTFDTSTTVPNSNNSWNKDKDKDKNKMKNKKKQNDTDSSSTNPAARPDSLRREN